MNVAEESQRIRKLIFDCLSEEGYRPSHTDEGDIRLKYESLSVYIEFHTDDPHYLRILMPNYWAIESAEELQRAYRAASRTALRCKATKVMVYKEKDMWFSLEFIFDSDEDLSAHLMNRRFHLLASAYTEFKEQMKRVSGEAEDDQQARRH